MKLMNVLHRHGGVNWPSAERCEVCRLEDLLAEAHVENERLAAFEATNQRLEIRNRALRERRSALKRERDEARHEAERLRAENKRLLQELAELGTLEMNHEGACMRLKRERDKARLEREQLRVWKSYMMQSVASFVKRKPRHHAWWCGRIIRANAEMTKVTSLEDCVIVQLNAGEREPFMQDLVSGVITDEDQSE